VALVPVTATGTLLFQTLMFNDLDRFFWYFDFLAARQDGPFNLGQTFATTLAIICPVLDDFVRLVAELERFPCSSFLPTRLALRFRPLTQGPSQPVTGGWLVAVLTVLVEALFQLGHFRFQRQKQINYFFRLSPAQFKQFISSRHTLTVVILSFHATISQMIVC